MVVWSDNNGDFVDAGSTRVLLTNSQGFVSLTLNSVAEEDAGEWMCTIEVENVHTIQYSITLTVLGKIEQFLGGNCVKQYMFSPNRISFTATKC